jgi:cobalt-zinc-cadmium efflux system membrane fusion protein
MIRVLLLLAGIALGAIAANLHLASHLSSWVGRSRAAPENDGGAQRAETTAARSGETVMKLAERQIEAAGIEVTPVGEGVLARRLRVPGTIIPSGDRIARAAVKLTGTVAELRKRLGDTVAQGEIVAVIESREVADAKSEYLATKTTHDLQQTLFARAKMLWEAKVQTENDYLRARAAAEDARIKMEVARQKLSALGLTEDEIAALPVQPVGALRRHDIRAPIAGRIAERRVDLGAPVGREGQESELFVIVDLDVVWVELAVPSSDLGLVREGQELAVIDGATGAQSPAKIIFISPLLDKDTRTARVVAALENATHAWRPGAFVTAEIAVARQRAEVVVPKTALQTINGERHVFVRTADGFEARRVRLGREDDRAVEVVSGLATRERIAARNSFILKAELGKSDSEH